MKTITVLIERTEDAFYATCQGDLEGVSIGAHSIEELLKNIDDLIEEVIPEVPKWQKMYGNGYRIKYKVDLSGFFALVPELSLKYIAESGELKYSVLRQYASGRRMASLKYSMSIIDAISRVVDGITQRFNKLNGVSTN